LPIQKVWQMKGQKPRMWRCALNFRDQFLVRAQLEKTGLMEVTWSWEGAVFHRKGSITGGEPDDPGHSEENGW